MTDFSLVDEKNNTVGEISPIGEQYVAPRYYSDPYYVQIDTAGTPFLIVPAKSGHKFIITSLLFASSKTFGSATTAETLIVYEANSDDLSTNTKTITQVDLLKNDRLIATGLNLAASESKALVASATGNDVDVTIAGYYAPC